MHAPWNKELRSLLGLALPVITVQVGVMLMGFVDAMMLGHYTEEALASAALGNLYSMLMMLFGFGVLVSLDPVMSQAVGARDDGAITRNLQRGLVLCVALMIPTALAHFAAGPVLTAFGQRPELVPHATNYVWILIPSILPFYCFQILRTTLQAYHRTAAIVWTILIANLANVFCNWALIFGHLGFDPMGVEGSAIGTTLCRWLMFLVLFFIGRKQFLSHLTPWSASALEPQPLRRLLRVGSPIGVQMLLEFGAFGTTLLFMGWISVSALAGHMAAINLASMTYVVTLGLSVATSVRVGHGVGRGDLSGARWSAVMGLGVAAVIMVGFAVVFIVAPEPLAALFSEDSDVGAREVALTLLPIAAVFQVMDGVQVVALGALRGIADTRAPMLINLLGFWGLGVPCGYYFAFGLDGGPEGLWWGLTVGLTAVAVFLTARVWVKLRQDLVRTVIDDGDAPRPA